jgi:ribosomal protein S18 acetylase RimI-like enzyme
LITIEKVKPEDALEVKQLLSETWADTYAGILSQQTIQTVTTAWHSPHLLAQQAQNPDLYFAIAQDENGKKLGLITIGKAEDNALMLYRLYVHPDFQRQGIGGKLVEAALLEFPAAKLMRLEVEAENKKGIAFYLKNGFKEIARKDEAVEGEVLKVIVMEKSLISTQGG